MPRYVVGCKNDHNLTIRKPVSEFDEFKRQVEHSWCIHWTGDAICHRAMYIKTQPVGFEMKIRDWSKD